MIDSVIDHNISISKYNPLAGSSFIKLPNKLDHPRKILINIQNIDDSECSKWSIVIYLSPTDQNPRRIPKTDKDFAKKLDCKDIKFPVKIRDIHKIEKKNYITISVFGYENKKSIQSMYQRKPCEENHADLLLIGDEGKRHYLLMKDFNAFMHDYTLYFGRKYFCRFCLQAFSTEETLKRHTKNFFKIMANKEL